MRMVSRASFVAVAVAVGLSAAPASSATVGQPFLVADGPDASGSILDFFDDFTGGPSGVKQVTLAGTITQAFGAPSLAGQPLAFSTDQSPGGASASLTVGSTTIDGFQIFSNSAGSYDYDPFEPGPGDLNFSFFITPPFTEVGPFEDPTFVYGGAFSEYPSRNAEFPEFEVMLSAYLDGPLPTEVFEVIDPDTGAVLDSFEYIEGTLPVSRITLGVVGGEPVPDAVIPLPAGLPLLAGALGLLALVRLRRSA